MRKYNLPIFIPHRGCPHDCAFCSQRKITGVDTDVTTIEVRGLIESFLETVETDDSSIEIAFFGGSFTGLELSTQEEFLQVAAEFYPRVSGIRLSTRPDYINEEILTLLKKYGVTTIELGVQSSDDEVLHLNKRGHSFEDVKISSAIIKEFGIDLGLQMMLGMYGSNPEKDRQTIEDIITIKPSCVRIYPVITLKGTALEDYYNNGVYTPYTVDVAAQLAKEALVRFEKEGIRVIKIGLHSSEELNGEDTIAGPYHPAFGEIVESLVFRDKIEDEVLRTGIRDNRIVFSCSNRDVSKAIGHKGMNKTYFKEKYCAELKVVHKEEGAV